MQSMLKKYWLVIACGLLTCAAPTFAAPVGSGQFQMQANGIDVCLLVTFDSVSNDVFGTPVNLADTGTLFCAAHLVGNDLVGSCVSRPDGSLLSFDPINKRLAPPQLPAVGVPDPFVATATSVSGSLLAPVGPVTLVFNSTVAWDGTTDPATTIPGCPLGGTAWNFNGQVVLNVFRPAVTNTGSNVAVSSTASYVDQSGVPHTADVAVTFDGVSVAGTTNVTATSTTSGSISPNFSVNIGGLDPIYLDISTTAAITGRIQVCQHYPDANGDGIVDGTGVAAADLRILHGEGFPVVFVDRTVLPVDTVNKLVCASVTSLSPFVLAVNVATPPSEHDSVVLPHGAVKATIKKGKTAVKKSLMLQVVNADLDETAGHEIRLAVTGSTCPASLLRDSLNQPAAVDFAPKTQGAQSSVVVPGGKLRVGTLPLNLRSEDFASPNAKSPARCTLTLTASAVTTDTVIEPNPSNNQITVDIEVIDKNDF